MIHNLPHRAALGRQKPRLRGRRCPCSGAACGNLGPGRPLGPSWSHFWVICARRGALETSAAWTILSTKPRRTREPGLLQAAGAVSGSFWGPFGPVLEPSRAIQDPHLAASGRLGALGALAAWTALSTQRRRVREPGFLEATGAASGPSRGHLGPSWSLPGQYWGHQGRIGPSRATISWPWLRGRFRPRSGAACAILGSWRPLGPSWSHLQAIWTRLGALQGPHWIRNWPRRAALELWGPLLRGRCRPRSGAACVNLGSWRP